MNKVSWVCKRILFMLNQEIMQNHCLIQTKITWLLRTGDLKKVFFYKKPQIWILKIHNPAYWCGADPEW